MAFNLSYTAQDLNAAVAKANAAAPQSTTYTKNQVDTALASKASLVAGKVPASELPSYVDDTVEGYYYDGNFYEDSDHTTVITGERGKIYIDLTANKSYRWTGTVYTRIDECPAFGETAGTIYEGNKGKANADAIAKKPGEITSGKQYTIDGQTVTAGTGAEVFNNLTYNKASGQYSHAEGVGTTSSGFSSHTEGASTTASGASSHAEGSNTTASGASSHAEGSNTTASGTNSHAEGIGTTASAINSHAEGGTTNASGVNSHAEGGVTTASGINSHAEGDNTKASSANQHVQGRYNVVDPNNRFAFIIGNGSADNNRHNAFAVDWNGLIYVNGASTGVDVSALAQQSTTYTKSEVDVALAAKLNTSDVDTALSSTSTNPVQNKAVQAPIASLVDRGAKNLLKVTATSQTITGVTFTVANDGTVTIDGTNTGGSTALFTLGDIALPANVTYNLSGCPSGGSSDTYYLGSLDTVNWQGFLSDYGAGASGSLTAPKTIRFRIGVRSGTTVSNLIFKPMLCTAEDYAISTEFVPYAPSNLELYEMILALQNAQNGG